MGDIRKIDAALVTETVKDLFIEANYKLPSDIRCAIKNCRACEDSALGQNVLDKIIENYEIAEGENVVEEAILYKSREIESIFVTKKFLHKVEKSEYNIYLVPEYIMESISDTKSPQGIMAVMRINYSDITTGNDDLIVYLDNVSDPGNVGTIIRTADAAGVGTVVLSPECADVFSPKVIRATMGSCFHINIVKEKKYLEDLMKLLDKDFKAIAGSLQATDFHYDADLKAKTVICLGNEAHGLSDDLLSLNGIHPVKIPIIGKAESLNVAIAGAVLMYECLRQRGGKLG